MNKIKFILKSLLDVIVLLYYKTFFTLKKEKMTDVWLISERGIDARDNGYWFYKYMKVNHPEQKIKYVISKSSADYKKIDSEDIVEYRTKEHYYYFLYSRVLISAQIMGFSPNEQLYYRLNKRGFLKLKSKTVFLQHGISQDFIDYLLPNRTKLDLFVCGAKQEYEHVLSSYKYSPRVAKLTGFARFDKLKDQNENYILVMPTWRKWLKYETSLKGSEYHTNFMKLLNDPEIINLLETKNMKLIFYPHIMLQKFLKEFTSPSKNVIIADFDHYDVQDLLKKSRLLITDYSSVAFDFAYMRKKVLYFQFDLDKFRMDRITDSYYDYENDGFGPVAYKYDDLKEKLINYLEDNQTFKEYDSRIDDFFPYNDTKNSERIYEEIKKISK